MAAPVSDDPAVNRANELAQKIYDFFNFNEQRAIDAKESLEITGILCLVVAQVLASIKNNLFDESLPNEAYLTVMFKKIANYFEACYDSKYAVWTKVEERNNGN